MMLAPYGIAELGGPELQHLATVPLDQLVQEVAAGRWNPAFVWADPRVSPRLETSCA